jgi:hypothetical protein
MGYYLDWYRRLVCEAEGHTHGEEGELEGILTRLARLQKEERPTRKSEPLPSMMKQVARREVTQD